MNRIDRGTRVLLGVVLTLALAGAGPLMAEDENGWKGKMNWVVVDADGTRHDESFDFDGPRPFLGVGLEHASERGARIDMIVEDSAAEAAGLREGDIVLRFDGTEIETPLDLTRAVLQSQPGDRVRIEVDRDGNRETLTAELGEQEDWVGAFAPLAGDGRWQLRGLDSEALHQKMEELGERLGEMKFNFDFGEHDGRAFAFRSGKPRLGVELVTVTAELREHLGARGDEGVLVGRVLEDSAAENGGVEVGDLIVAVGGETVGDHDDLVRLLAERDGETFNLDVIREGRSMTLTISLPERDEETVAPGRFQRRLHREPAGDRT